MESAKNKKIVYSKVFGSEFGEEVLGDLKVFCFGDYSNEPIDDQGRVDANKMLINEGRRQVYNQIIAVMNFDHNLYADLEEDDD